MKANEFWIARDWSGLIIFRKKPIYSKIAKVFYAGGHYVCKLPTGLFPEIKLNNPPQKVRIELVKELKNDTIK